MNFSQLVDRLIEDTVQTSLGRFSPELTLCVTIVALLFVRLFNADRVFPTSLVALFGAGIAFFFAFQQSWSWQAADFESVEIFTGLLMYDKFTIFFRVFLLLFLVFVVALTILSGIPDLEDGPDFYTLLLGAVVGMHLMAGANHLLIVFLGVEMASVPSYAMVGFLKGRRKSSEAALKFVVYGAGAAGVMLYGISLLAGLLGTADMPEMAARLNLLVNTEAGMSDPIVRTLALGIFLVMVGLAFKLSIVPFHFWCPDAFEGAPAEVAGFLSVASKAAAFALLVRFCLAFVGSDPGPLADIYLHFGIGLGVVASVTATFGNLAAYAQTNMKRLLAYSTIAHAGYMLMAVAAMLVLLNAPAGSQLNTQYEAKRCVEGLLYYLGVYFFMNLGAFAIVALIRNQTFSEEIEDYAGIGWQAPLLGVGMLMCLFSLIGLPPMGGFWGKVFILLPMWSAGSVHWSMYAFVSIALLNTVFSLFYYARVLNVMYFQPRPDGAPAVENPSGTVGAYVVCVSLPVLGLGIFVEPLSRAAQHVVAMLVG